MYCIKCGKMLASDACFCSDCGTKVNSAGEKNAHLGEKRGMPFSDNYVEKQNMTEYLTCTDNKKQKNRKVIICVLFIVFASGVALLATRLIIPDMNYRKAVEFLSDGDMDNALIYFEKSGVYRDAKERKSEIEQYMSAEELMNRGDIAGAAIAFGKCGEFYDAGERSSALWDDVALRNTISIEGSYHAIGIKQDGSVLLAGYMHEDCDISDWTDIVDVSTDSSWAVGLKQDGTVVATYLNYSDDSNIGVFRYSALNGELTAGWSDIVAIDTGNGIYGLKQDGTVVNVGGENEVSGWSDIIAISSGGYVAGLKRDSTVVTAGLDENSKSLIENWSDIVAISVGGYGDRPITVGLKRDGTVAVVGLFDDCSAVEDWSDIVAISAGDEYIVGLKRDGSVVVVGSSVAGGCEVENWSGIVAISAGQGQTIGLKADGTMVTTIWSASYSARMSDVSGWTDIRCP